jgi:hypothetical protein
MVKQIIIPVLGRLRQGDGEFGQLGLQSEILPKRRRRRRRGKGRERGRRRGRGRRLILTEFLFFVILAFELRAYTLNHSTSPFL